MSRCVECKFAEHDQFKGYPGRWVCFHPHRREISNRGTFTYPANSRPQVVICETPAADFDRPEKHNETLKAAKTPVWCYIEAVERTRIQLPGFDPNVQRKSL